MRTLRFLSALMLFLNLVIITGCDSGLEVADIEISKYPNRIVYYVGEDSHLDLDGLKICVTLKSGKQEIESWSEYSSKYDIIQEIDFNTPGVYVVSINRHTSTCNFAIEVIAR